MLNDISRIRGSVCPSTDLGLWHSTLREAQFVTSGCEAVGMKRYIRVITVGKDVFGSCRARCRHPVCTEPPASGLFFSPHFSHPLKCSCGENLEDPVLSLRIRIQASFARRPNASAMSERSVLCLYAGGTLGMIKHDGTGYAPYPGFLTETLRTQARFHDPHADSIFSWSDTTDRFKQWSEVYSKSHPPTRSGSPAENATSSGKAGHESPLVLGSHTPMSGPPFSKPLRVRSSDPKGTSTRNAVSKKLMEDGTLEMQLPSLITPKSSHNQQRVRYAVLEYDPLLDSSEMSLEDWTRMAKDIELNYSSFDAFVILHGTDTMSFTASAMSFLLENLGKTVIITGAQVPLSELRNDAVENVLGALILASSYIIPEVCLFFASTLYRGNRSSKVSNNALAAFDSPNLPPLARVGIGIDVAWNLVERSKTARSFRAHDRMSSEVALLRLFPGMPTSTIKSFLSSSISGLVIESFGAGNAPSRPDLLEAFRDATQRGVVIVNITQCLQGEVSAIYALGQKLAAVGVVAGADMTPEVSSPAQHCGIPTLELSLTDITASVTVRSHQTCVPTLQKRIHSSPNSRNDGSLHPRRAHFPVPNRRCRPRALKRLRLTGSHLAKPE